MVALAQAQRLFDWQAERITLAIIALVLHEQRKRQRRHHVTSVSVSLAQPLSFLLPSLYCLLASFCAMQLLTKKASSAAAVVVGPKYGPNSTATSPFPRYMYVCVCSSVHTMPHVVRLGSQSVIEVIYCHQCCTLFLPNNCTKFPLLLFARACVCVCARACLNVCVLIARTGQESTLSCAGCVCNLWTRRPSLSLSICLHFIVYFI